MRVRDIIANLFTYVITGDSDHIAGSYIARQHTFCYEAFNTALNSPPERTGAKPWVVSKLYKFLFCRVVKLQRNLLRLERLVGAGYQQIHNLMKFFFAKWFK